MRPHRSRARMIATSWLLAGACAAAAQSQTQQRSTTLPTFAELQSGWNVLRPGGETICAKGGDYSFFVRPSARDKLLVFFQGGGGCWRGEECEQGMPFYLPEVSTTAQTPLSAEGIFDLERPDNPFSAYSIVFLPYCTGDVHLGDRDTTYTVKSGSGETRELRIHHRGQTNATAVLRWIHENVPAPADIFISGTSAGAHPVPFYGAALARHYPRARIVGLGDSQGHSGVSLPAPANNQWGFPTVIRRHAGWEQFPDDWNPSDLYIAAARLAPRLQLLQFNHAYDAIIRSYMRLQGRVDTSDMQALLRSDQREIARRVPSFRSYTVGGRGHGAMPTDLFYAFATGGRLLRDWVADAAAGRPVTSVDCTDCSRAEYRFSEQDLRIVERSLALVSAPGAWNSDNPPQRCGPKLDRYSLECALLTAVRDVTERPPHFRYAGVWEVVNTVIARMGEYFVKLDDPQRGGETALPLRLFNNRLGTTAADVISTLEEARGRIRADLARRRQK